MILSVSCWNLIIICVILIVWIQIWVTPRFLRPNVFTSQTKRPVKNGCFPASRSEWASSLIKFPSSISLIYVFVFQSKLQNFLAWSVLICLFFISLSDVTDNCEIDIYNSNIYSNAIMEEVLSSVNTLEYCNDTIYHRQLICDPVPLNDALWGEYKNWEK